jgi:hypothetical protein
MRKYGKKPKWFLNLIISVLGEYYTEVWYKDYESEEGGLFYNLFGFKVCYAWYFNGVD